MKSPLKPYPLPEAWPSQLDPQRLLQIQREAQCLYDAQAIETIYDQLACAVAKDMGDQIPVCLAVMNGGLPLSAALLSRFDFLLELDYVHLSRYGDKTTGGALQWLAKLKTPIEGRAVLVIDDIFDVGLTLKAITEACEQSGAASVSSCVLVDKQHDRKAVGDWRPDYIGLEVQDDYLFGCGMDYKGFFRNLNGIYALPEKYL